MCFKFITIEKRILMLEKMKLEIYSLVTLLLLISQVKCQYQDAIIGLSVTVGVLGLVFIVIIVVFVTSTILSLVRTSKSLKNDNLNDNYNF